MTAPFDPEAFLRQLREGRTEEEKKDEFDPAKFLSDLRANRTSVSSPSSFSPEKLEQELRKGLTPTERGETGVRRGLIAPFVNAPATAKAIVGDLGNFGRAILEDPLGTLGSTIGEAVTSLPAMLVDEFKGLITNPIQLAADSWMDQLVGENRGKSTNWLANAFNLTEEEEYQKAAASVQSYIGLAAGGAVGKVLRKAAIGGAAKVLSKAEADASIGRVLRNASPEQVIEYAANHGAAVPIKNAIDAIKTGPREVVKRTLLEGGALGLSDAVLDPNLQYSDSPARDAFFYGVAGTLMAGGFELGAEGIRKVRGKTSPEMTFKNALGDALNYNLSRIMTADAAIDFAENAWRVSQVSESLLGDLSSSMEPDSHFVMEVPENWAPSKTPENVSIYRNNETGKKEILIVGKGLQAFRKRTDLLEDPMNPGEALLIAHGTNIDFDGQPTKAPVLGGTASFFTNDPTLSNSFAKIKGIEESAEKLLRMRESGQNEPHPRTIVNALKKDSKIFEVTSPISSAGHDGTANVTLTQLHELARAATIFNERLKLDDSLIPPEVRPELHERYKREISSFTDELKEYALAFHMIGEDGKFIDPGTIDNSGGTIQIGTRVLGDIAREAGYDVLRMHDLYRKAEGFHLNRPILDLHSSITDKLVTYESTKLTPEQKVELAELKKQEKELRQTYNKIKETKEGNLGDAMKALAKVQIMIDKIENPHDLQTLSDLKYYVLQLQSTPNFYSLDGPADIKAAYNHYFKEYERLEKELTVKPVEPSDLNKMRAKNPRQEIIVMNMDKLVPYYSGKDPVVTDKALKDFSRSGFFDGMTVQMGGRDYSVVKQTGNKVRIIDSATGKISTVDKSSVTRVPAGKVFDKPENIRRDATGTDRRKMRADLPVSDIGEGGTAEISKIDELDPIISDETRVTIEMGNDLQMRKLAGRPLYAMDKLTRNGYYIDRAKDGTVSIKSFTDPKFERWISGRSPKAYMDAIDALLPEINARDLVKKTQADLIGTSLSTSNAKVTYTPTGLKRGKLENWIHSIRASKIAKPIVPMMSFVQSLDAKVGTNIAPRLNSLIQTVRDEVAKSEPFRQRAQSLLTHLYNLPEGVRENLIPYINSMSFDEWKFHGTSGVRPSNIDLQFVTDLTTNITSDQRQRAKRYVSEALWLEDQFDHSTQKGQQGYIEAVHKLGMKYGIGEEGVIKAVRHITDMYDVGGIDAYNIFRGADILQEGGLSRKDYAAKNGLDSKFTSLAAEFDTLFQDLGKELDIDGKMLLAYMPEYAKYNPKDLSFDFIGKDKWIPNKLRDFASDLVRVGYFNDSQKIMDVGDIVSKYINAGFRNRYREGELVKLRDELNELMKQTTEHPNDPTVKVPLIDPKARKGLEDLFNRISRAVNLIEDPQGELAEVSADKYIEKLIGRHGYKPDWMTSWLKYMEFKTQGFKPVAGVRDGVASITSYLINFGPARTAKMLKMVHEGRKLRDARTEAGIIPSLEQTRIGQAGISDISAGEIGGTERLAKMGDNLSRMGFKGSLQPQVYRAMHDAAYLETTKTVGEELNKFLRGKITQDKFRRNIELDRYDDHVITEFEKLMKEENYPGAIDFLSRQTGRIAVGEYSRMTASMLFESKFGRVMGQFSQWPMWAIDMLGTSLARKNNVQRAKTIAGIAASIAVSYEVAEETGLDFLSWTFHPLGWLPQGSPVMQLIGDLGGSVGYSSFAASAVNAAKNQAAFMVNPVPLGIQNAIEAAQRYDNGDPAEVILFRLFGGRINTKLFEKPSLWD